MSEENNDKKKAGKSVDAGKPDAKGDKREEERRAKMKELLNPIDGTADKNAGPRKPNWRSILLYALILVVVVVAVGSAMQRQANENTVELATSEFVSAVEDGQVSEATYVAMTYTIKGEYWPEADKIGDENALVPFTSTYLGTDSLAELMASHPEVKYVADVSTTPTWVSLLTSMLPMLILIGVMVYFMNKFSDPTGGAMGFGKTKAQTTDATRPKVCFDDVAGCDEAIEELKEIKDYLDNPAKYQDLGAKIPHGVLLVGPPGTGKTLLAKAVAGEAGVPFFQISGSGFVEMFVGVGASRVRDLFAKAKEQAPSIIFIDEIDAVGRQRGTGVGGGHDEREQTLNQLLVEMDGFEEHQSVILMAATNRPDVLDPALLRPGRFDRQVTVDRPDVKGREAILGIHARNKPLSTDVDLARVAQLTPGFSGADLGNLMNESALLAARRGHERIGMDEITESMERCIAGPARKSRVMTDTERKTIAYHESGHALVGHMLANADPVKKISIIPRGQALGYTLSMPDEDHFLQTRNSMLDSLAMMLGGRTAEELFCDDITTGASNDIERATKVARSMVVSYGMCEELGPQMYGEPNHEVFLGRDIATQGNYSPETAHRIDLEVSRLIKEAHERARKVLSENAEQMHLMATVLLERETVDGDACQALLDNRWQEYLAGEAEQKAKVAAADAAKTAEERAAKETENQLPEAESVVKVDSCDAEVRTNADGSTTVVYDGHAQTLPPVEGEPKDEAEAGEKKGE